MRRARAGGLGTLCLVCGIAGIVRIHPPGSAPPVHVAIPEALLDLLDQSIGHRGPDGHGRFRDRAVRPDGMVVDVALVHRRLSIIDHAGGHQPMVLCDPTGASGFDGQGSSIAPGARQAPNRHALENSLKPCPRCTAQGCRTVAVVFNGCVYNHRDLRRELLARGHQFSTDHSDTEVLVHGWAEWTDQLWPRLESMFAVALWDSHRSSLTLARDQFGEKPLHGVSFRHGDAEWRVFASTPAGPARVLRRLGGDLPSAAMADVATWLRFGFGATAPGPGGFGYSVQPSRRLDLAQDRLHQLAFHRLWPADGPPKRAARLAENHAETLLRAAVARRLEADVPLACFLSGGVDSSLVALFARESLGSLRTFSVRMPDPRYDESAYASQVAGRIGSNHETLDCQASPAEDLQALIHRCGMPLGDSSLLPAHWVSRAARSAVPVAIGGDGGDELFLGYDRYAAIALLRRWGAALSLASSLAPPGREQKSLAVRARRLGAAARGGYRELVSIFGTADLSRLLPDPAPAAQPISDSGPLGLSIDDAVRWDLRNYLPGDLLAKVDTASMHVALEVRSPFLDTDLARAAMTASIDTLTPGGRRKGLLRDVARRHLPPVIANRPKMGFAIPVGEWFRTDHGGMRQLLLDHLGGPEPFGPDHLGIGPLINMAFVRRMLREHDDAGARSLWPWKGREHSQRLYMLLVLSIWAKWFAGLDDDGRGRSTP